VLASFEQEVINARKGTEIALGIVFSNLFLVRFGGRPSSFSPYYKKQVKSAKKGMAKVFLTHQKLYQSDNIQTIDMAVYIP